MVRNFIKEGYHSLKSLYRVAKSGASPVKLLPRECDSIFVFANGPSVREQIRLYPEMCINHDVMCMNYMANADFFDKIKPKYYIIADSNIFSPDDMCSRELLLSRNKGLENIIKKTQWDMQFFVPSFAKNNKDFYNKIGCNPYINIRYFGGNTFNGFKSLTYFFLEKGLAVPGMQTVLIPAIYLAIIMGYKDIYLFGAEHSWMHDIFCDDENRLYTYDKHAYGEVKRFLFKDQYGKEPTSMNDVFKSLMEVFSQHNLLNEFAKYMGSHIYNVTPDSLLDVYERKKLKEILE